MVLADGTIGARGTEAAAVWQLSTRKLDGFASYRWTWDGRGPWEGVTVLCAPPAHEADPWRWYVMLRAERLWRDSMRGIRCADTVRAVVAGLANHETGAGIMGEEVPLVKWLPARVDPCRDHGGYDWEVEDLAQFATRSPKWSRGCTLSAVDVKKGREIIEEISTRGARGGMTLYRGSKRSECCQLKIYCKTVEASVSGKSSWLVPYWRWAFMGHPDAQGPLPLIWRAEVQFGGAWLRSHGFKTGEDLVGCEEALWGYYTTVVRHTLARTGQMRHECPSPMWRLLADAKATVHTVGAWTYQPAPDRQHERDMAHLTKQAAGCLARVVEDLYRPTCDAELLTALDATMAAVRERAHMKALGYYATGMAEPDKRPGKAGALPAPGGTWDKAHPWDGPAPVPRQSRAERWESNPLGDADPFA